MRAPAKALIDRNRAPFTRVEVPQIDRAVHAVQNRIHHALSRIRAHLRASPVRTLLLAYGIGRRTGGRDCIVLNSLDTAAARLPLPAKEESE